MSEFLDQITPELAKFIRAQPVFFVATAAPGSRINLSPKGMDTFRVLDEKRVAYLDLTGSGNETAAHLLHDGRITIMFCSFDANAEIARIYGRGAVVRPADPRWAELIAHFPKLHGVRQVMEINVESAMTSCGYGVPRTGGTGEMTGRDTLAKYWSTRGEEKKEQYQHKICGASTACQLEWMRRRQSLRKPHREPAPEIPRLLVFFSESESNPLSLSEERVRERFHATCTTTA